MFFMCVYAKSLGEFTRVWNIKPVRTEKDWSLQQIMINSMIREANIMEILMFRLRSDEGPAPDELVRTVEIPKPVGGTRSTTVFGCY